MDIGTWIQLISDTGVPLAILAVTGWFGLRFLKEYIANQQKKDEQSRLYLVERVEKSEKRQEELLSMGQKLSDTNRILSEKLIQEVSDIKDEISEVNNKMDILAIKLSKE